MLEQVISGGQTGVDQLALHEAREAGIATGGTAPLLWMTEDGPAPWLADYGLVQCTTRGYPPRTWENVKNSHGTVIFGDERSDGSISTLRACFAFEKPKIINPTPEKLIAFIEEHNIRILNVAGNRKSKLSWERIMGIRAVLNTTFYLIKHPTK